MAIFSPEPRMPNAKHLVAFLLLALSPAPVHAQNAAAPPLFDVEEVIVQPIHFGNDKVSQVCGLSPQELGDALLKTLVDNGVPAFSPSEARPPSPSRARIDLVPGIFSYTSVGLDCISWLSLSAESHNSIHVPPVDLARSVSVVYWREGSLLSSDQSSHEDLLKETLQKQALHLAAQYKQDQPPQQHQ
jgi:hypothetical protein